jgi:hypothetical protein
MRRGHPLRHGAAHAPKRFRWSGFDQAVGSTLNVSTCDGTLRARRLHMIKVNLQLARQRTHSRQDLARLGRCPMITDWLVDPGLGPFGVQLSNYRPRINLGTLSELDKRSAHLDQVSLASEQPSDTPILRRGDLDHSLVGLDGDERLVNNDVIAFSDVPGDDLSFLEAFSKIRQQELMHGRCNLDYVNRQARRAALTTRSMDGI